MCNWVRWVGTCLLLSLAFLHETRAFHLNGARLDISPSLSASPAEASPALDLSPVSVLRLPFVNYKNSGRRGNSFYRFTLVLSATQGSSNLGDEDSASASTSSPQLLAPMVIVFGRPGAGKTTVANQAADLMQVKKQDEVLALDLDVCVPQWMRDNFANGMYPTLEQRIEFAKDACQYVTEQQEKQATALTTVVSFSFVNTDLRDVFRESFPDARWILIDTTEGEAQRRIDEREGHFYKGGAATVEEEEPIKEDEADNSDWDFAPVSFDHVCLPGANSIEENAQLVVEIVDAICA
jgi:gluconate kinase